MNPITKAAFFNELREIEKLSSSPADEANKLLGLPVHKKKRGRKSYESDPEVVVSTANERATMAGQPIPASSGV